MPADFEAPTTDPEARELGLATAALRAGRLAEARQRYAAILARSPDNAPALQALARIALNTGNKASAAELIERLLARTPNDVGTPAHFDKLDVGILDVLGCQLLHFRPTVVDAKGLQRRPQLFLVGQYKLFPLVG